MNLNITRSFLNNYNVVSTGYCNLQHLLRYKDRIGRNAGVYGWNYDCFRFNNFMLITGYRCNVSCLSLDTKIIKKYEKLALKLKEKIRADFKKYDYNTEIKLYERLRAKFEKEVNNIYFK